MFCHLVKTLAHAGSDCFTDFRQCYFNSVRQVTQQKRRQTVLATHPHQQHTTQKVRYMFQTAQNGHTKLLVLSYKSMYRSMFNEMENASCTSFKIKTTWSRRGIAEMLYLPPPPKKKPQKTKTPSTKETPPVQGSHLAASAPHSGLCWYFIPEFRQQVDVSCHDWQYRCTGSIVCSHAKLHLRCLALATPPAPGTGHTICNWDAWHWPHHLHLRHLALATPPVPEMPGTSHTTCTWDAWHSCCCKASCYEHVTACCEHSLAGCNFSTVATNLCTTIPKHSAFWHIILLNSFSISHHMCLLQWATDNCCHWKQFHPAVDRPGTWNIILKTLHDHSSIVFWHILCGLVSLKHHWQFAS